MLYTIPETRFCRFNFLREVSWQANLANCSSFTNSQFHEIPFNQRNCCRNTVHNLLIREAQSNHLCTEIWAHFQKQNRYIFRCMFTIFAAHFIVRFSKHQIIFTTALTINKCNSTDKWDTVLSQHGDSLCWYLPCL